MKESCSRGLSLKVKIWASFLIDKYAFLSPTFYPILLKVLEVSLFDFVALSPFPSFSRTDFSYALLLFSLLLLAFLPLVTFSLAQLLFLFFPPLFLLFFPMQSPSLLSFLLTSSPSLCDRDRLPPSLLSSFFLCFFFINLLSFCWINTSVYLNLRTIYVNRILNFLINLLDHFNYFWKKI